MNVGKRARPLAGDVNDNRSLSSWFRRKRDYLLRAFILAHCDKDRTFRILDIGGSAAYWQRVGVDFLLANRIEVTCVDTGFACSGVAVASVVEQPGDGRSLDFPDFSFDMVHSNSVIEHVGRSADMRQFADEVRRLAPAYYVQTPNFWFPIDPHFYRVPFFHWLPQPLRVALVQRFRVGLNAPMPDIGDALAYVEFAVPLDRRHLESLFPDAVIRNEKFLLMTKSMIALRSSRPDEITV